MPKGTIRRLMDRGYGFIKSELGEDLFFHSSELQGVDFNSLKEEQAVEFEVGKGPDGRSRAVSVRLSETQADDDGGDVGDDGGEGGDDDGNGDGGD